MAQSPVSNPRRSSLVMIDSARIKNISGTPEYIGRQAVITFGKLWRRDRLNKTS